MSSILIMISCFQTKMRKPPHFSDLTLHAFFISNNFISHVSLKLSKSQANAKQHPDTELLFENYSHPCYYPKIEYILKIEQKNICVCIHEMIRLIITKMKMKMKNRSYRFDMDINIVNRKSASVWWCFDVLSKT